MKGRVSERHHNERRLVTQHQRRFITIKDRRMLNYIQANQTQQLIATATQLDKGF